MRLLPPPTNWVSTALALALYYTGILVTRRSASLTKGPRRRTLQWPFGPVGIPVGILCFQISDLRGGVELGLSNTPRLAGGHFFAYGPFFVIGTALVSKYSCARQDVDRQ